ncbi:MAG: extracellular solute-binding protein [Microlunatus sp.]|nr:extracellular solute-binding protein [Microlunatus sp.]
MAVPNPGSGFSRRGFLGLAGGTGVAAAAVLTGCNRAASGGAGGGNLKPLKFWNMPWGNTQFNVLDRKITEAFVPPSGLSKATYQVIQWATWSQTFDSAVASNTGPAVSSGGGTQAFTFEAEGKIAYADNLLAEWKKNGLYDDFPDGLLDTMKTKNGYAAVPYNLDMRVIWVNKKLLDQAGAAVPTDWDTYQKACEALKKIGVYGMAAGAGAGDGVGPQGLVSWMINNGGGLFGPDQQPNMVTPENIEAMNFVIDAVKAGYVDPHSPGYSNANETTQWQRAKFAMGYNTAGLAAGLTGAVAKDVEVISPLTGPSGKKGALYFPNNIMMYTNTPSQKDSEAFMTYYYQHMKQLWTQHTGIGLPPLKSISQTPEFQQDKNAVKAFNEWQPISKTWAAPGSDSLYKNITSVDGTQPIQNFAQAIYGGKTTAKAALTTLQDATAKIIKGQS